MEKEIYLAKEKALFETEEAYCEFLWSLKTREISKDTLDFLKSNISVLNHPIYRCTMYNKRDIELGHIYEHNASVSSWSKSKEYAKNFLNGNEYIPEGILDRYAIEMGFDVDNYDYDCLRSDFAMVLLKLDNPVGVDIEQILMDNSESDFVSEREVQLLNTRLVFDTFEKKDHDFTNCDYYEIGVNYL